MNALIRFEKSADGAMPESTTATPTPDPVGVLDVSPSVDRSEKPLAGADSADTLTIASMEMDVTDVAQPQRPQRQGIDVGDERVDAREAAENRTTKQVLHSAKEAGPGRHDDANPAAATVARPLLQRGVQFGRRGEIGERQCAPDDLLQRRKQLCRRVRRNRDCENERKGQAYESHHCPAQQLKCRR